MVLTHLTNNDRSCINVASAFVNRLPQENFVSEVQSLNDGIFAEFCRPSCGNNILTAWSTCNVTINYEREVELVTGLCSRDRSMECYEATEAIFNFIEDVKDCSAEDVCSQECSDLIDDNNYGCCVNAPIDYLTAAGETDLPNVVDATFEMCSDDRELECGRQGLITSHLHEIVDVNPSLSPEQIVCITNALASDDDLQPACAAAANELILYFNSDSFTSSLSEAQSALSQFCSPSCGPRVSEIWNTCNAYEDIKAEADLVVALCGLNNGAPCYTQYRELVEDLDDGVYCGRRGDGIVCPTTCAAYYRTSAEEFGCCSSVFLDFLNDVLTFEDTTLDELVDTLYDACEVERTDTCTTSALTSTSTAEPTAMETMEPPRCVSAAAHYGPVLGLLIVTMVLVLQSLM